MTARDGRSPSRASAAHDSATVQTAANERSCVVHGRPIWRCHDAFAREILSPDQIDECLGRPGITRRVPVEVTLDDDGKQILAPGFRQYLPCAKGCGYLIGCGDAHEEIWHASCEAHEDRLPPWTTCEHGRHRICIKCDQEEVEIICPGCGRSVWGSPEQQFCTGRGCHEVVPFGRGHLGVRRNGKNLCLNCGVAFPGFPQNDRCDPAHDEHCEAEFVEGPMAWTDCQCRIRAHQRKHDSLIRELDGSMSCFMCGWRA